VHLANFGAKRRQIERPRRELDLPSEEVGPLGVRIECVARLATQDGDRDLGQAFDFFGLPHACHHATFVVHEQHRVDLAAVGERLDQVLQGLLPIFASLGSSFHGAKRIERIRRRPNFLRHCGRLWVRAVA
jgi:hypothetical protein